MEITIELGSENKNVNPFIEPLGAARRGKWRRSNLPSMNLADAEVAGLPDLPGYCVAVDLNARTVRIFDPLEHDPRRPDIEKALRKFFKRRLEIEPQQVSRDHAKPTLYRWLMWMQRLVAAGGATVVDGDIPQPTIDRIAKERHDDAARVGLRDDGDA